MFHGEYFDVEGVTFAPKCVQRPYPPILVGGNSKAALRRAARHDGWLPNPDRTTENRHGAGTGGMTLALEDIPPMLDYIKDQPEYARPTDSVHRVVTYPYPSGHAGVISGCVGV